MKKTMEGQFEVVKIDQIVKVEEFKNFYESQSEISCVLISKFDIVF